MMKWIAWIFLVLMTACGSSEVPQGTSAPITTEPDGGTPVVDNGPCTDDLDCPFGERCVEGVCLEDPGAGDLSGCDEDADCPEGMVCSEETGACVEPSNEPEVTVEQEGECVDGQVRPCGIKIGECDYGVETCVNGIWGECLGAVGPVEELCNGLDDDCDGVIDTAELDQDGDGFRVCEGDCQDDDNTIYPDAPEGCDGKDNDCDESVDEGGNLYCNDDLFCNGTESCLEGACTAGEAPNCSGLDTQCREGICDESVDGCVEAPLPDGGACDDGDLCSVGSICIHGECALGKT